MCSVGNIIFPSSFDSPKEYIRAGQTEIRNKIDVARGSRYGAVVEWRDDKLYITRTRLAVGNWDTVRQSLGRMDILVTYYEIREATTLFELALWKANIDREEGSTINRDAYRIEVPGSVKDTICNILDDNYNIYNME